MKPLLHYFASLSLLCGANTAIAQPAAQTTTAEMQAALDKAIDAFLTPPMAFTTKPIIPASVSRDEPFLEGTFRHTKIGIVKTDAYRGKIVYLPAGTRVYGFSSISSDGTMGTIWCGFPNVGKKKFESNCLANGMTASGFHHSMMALEFYVNLNDTYSGGNVEPISGDLFPGSVTTVKYYVKSVGRLSRFKVQVFVDGQLANEWPEIIGSIFRPKNAVEKQFSIGGGVLGISPDPAIKKRFLVREVMPLTIGGSAKLNEIREGQ